MPQDTVAIPCNVANDKVNCPATTNLAAKSKPCTLQFNLTPANGNYSWLATSPYGIEITSGSVEFTSWTRVSDTRVTCVDANNDGATYQYTASCNGPNGVVVGDPSIVNRGGN